MNKQQDQIDDVEMVRRMFETKKRIAAEYLAKFRADHERNPAEAMSWAAGAFDAAATFEVAGYVLKCLANGMTLAATAMELEENTFRRARGVGQSTSAAHNEMERCRLEAFASAFATLREVLS